MGERIASVLLAVREEDQPDELARLLRDAGVDVVVGPPGAAAGLDHLDVAVVELAVLGTGWAGEARRQHPDLEIVTVALRDEHRAALRALRQGASDVLAVPIEPAALLDAIARAADRSRAHAALRDASDLARWAELGRLSGGLTHEIANPVAVLLSATCAIDEGLEALGRGRAGAPPDEPLAASEASMLEQVREATHEAMAGAERLKVLARDLRSVVRADPTALAPADVAQAVSVALRLGRAEIAAQLDVAVRVPAGLAAFASAGALAEAVLHVLLRASRAAVAAGQRRAVVEVRAVQRGDAVVIEVEDALPAQPADSALRYLALRLPPGLAPCPGARSLVAARELVERQGGACAGRVAPGGGTVVEITLQAPVLPRDC